jgi:hypothetical protein
MDVERSRFQFGTRKGFSNREASTLFRSFDADRLIQQRLSNIPSGLPKNTPKGHSIECDVPAR